MGQGKRIFKLLWVYVDAVIRTNLVDHVKLPRRAFVRCIPCLRRLSFLPFAAYIWEAPRQALRFSSLPSPPCHQSAALRETAYKSVWKRGCGGLNTCNTSVHTDPMASVSVGGGSLGFDLPNTLFILAPFLTHTASSGCQAIRDGSGSDATHKYLRAS